MPRPQCAKQKESQGRWCESPLDHEGPCDWDAPDLVNHPPHYTSHPSGVECIQVAEHFNFSIGNAIKYLWRAGLKGDAVEDLKKARWYVDRELRRLGAA